MLISGFCPCSACASNWFVLTRKTPDTAIKYHQFCRSSCCRIHTQGARVRFARLAVCKPESPKNTEWWVILSWMPKSLSRVSLEHLWWKRKHIHTAIAKHTTSISTTVDTTVCTAIRLSSSVLLCYIKDFPSSIIKGRVEASGVQGFLKFNSSYFLPCKYFWSGAVVYTSQ